MQTRTVYLWMGDPLVKEELARQLDRIGDEFTRQVALAANTAITELRNMAELPVDGPLTSTEKLCCIQEILNRFSPSPPLTGQLQLAEQDLATLSDAELVAEATKLLAGLDHEPSQFRTTASARPPSGAHR